MIDQGTRLSGASDALLAETATTGKDAERKSAGRTSGSEGGSNPYVGPRPFKEEEWEYFFGRHYEAADLCSLVLANRLVLFYAPSGAGKSSLLNTGMRRKVSAEGFDVLPTTRVSGDMPAGLKRVANIFVFDVITDLDASRHAAADLVDLTLCDYLKEFLLPKEALESLEPRQQLLIIDQFEEIFTTHPEAWMHREEFFNQLRDAMEQLPSLWVILSMREENVAALDRYKNLLPGGLRTRFYMQSLDHDAALEAIELPAKKAGRPFEAGVAKILVNNLSLTWIRNHITRQYPGEFVEPLQLQVVCHQLWEDLRTIPGTTINLDHLQRVAGTTDLADFIDTALARFYDNGIRNTAVATGVPELDLRRWFEDQIITEAGTRNLVFCGEHTTGGLPNAAVKGLAQNLLLHAEERPAGTWVELIHDRLIGPILDANQAWYEEHPLILLAHEWDKSDRTASKLLEGQRLQAELAGDWRGLGELVREFLEASQHAEAERQRTQQAEERRRELEHQRALAEEAEARRKAEQERATEAERHQQEQTAAAHKLRKRAIALGVTTALALIAFMAAGFAWRVAAAERETAETQFAGMLATESEHVRAEKPQLSLLLAVEAVERSPRLNGEPAVTETIQALDQALAANPSTPLRTPNQQVIHDALQFAMSPQQDWLAVGSEAGQVYLWRVGDDDPDTAEYAQPVHERPVTALVFDPTGRWLGSGGADGTVAIFDMMAPGQEPLRVVLESGEGAPSALAFYPATEPEASWLAIGSREGVVQRLEWSASETPALTSLLGDQSRAVVSMAFDPQGHWLATVDEKDSLRVWSLADDLPITESQLLSSGKNGMIAVSPDSRSLAAGKIGDPFVNLFVMRDLGDSHHQAIGYFPLEGSEQGVTALGFSPEAEGALAIGSADGSVQLWYPASLAASSSVEVSQPAAVPEIQPPPDHTPLNGKQAIPLSPVEAGQTSGDAETDALSTVLPVMDEPTPLQMEGSVLALDFARTSADGSTPIWEPSSAWLAVAGTDQTVHIWNADNATELSTYASGHEAGLASIEFAADSDLSFALAQDGTARMIAPALLKSPTEEALEDALSVWEAEACHRAGRELTDEEQNRYFKDVNSSSYCESVYAGHDDS